MRQGIASKRRLRLVGVAEEEAADATEEGEADVPHLAVPVSAYARLKALERAVQDALAGSGDVAGALRAHLALA